MKNLLKIFVSIFSFLFLINLSTSFSSDTLDQLLTEYSEKADLSNETKVETSGSVIIFTRKDLDRMKVKSLNELIELVPFLRYNVDDYGYTDPLFSPTQLNTKQLTKLYINDREVVTPFLGSSLTLMSMLDLEYVDHIEIYLGMSSFSKDTSSATITFKLYTKKPQREATNVVGSSTDNLHSKEFYAYSAHELKYFSYLLSLNYRNSKSKTFEYNNKDIHKDHDFFDAFGQINFKQHRFEAQYIQLHSDIFLGNITNLTPENGSDTSLKYLYGGWFYKSKDKKTNAHLYMTYGKNNLYEKGDYVMILPVPSLFLPVTFYDKRDVTTIDKTFDFNATHLFCFGKSNLLFGVKTRYITFQTIKSVFNGEDFDLKDDYNSELIPGAFTEYTLKITNNDIIKALLKYEKYYEDDEVRNFEGYEARLGYIKYYKNFGFKTFAGYIKYPPSPYYNYYNENVKVYTKVADLNEAKNTVFSTELLYDNKDNFNASFMIAKVLYEDTTYFDGIKYKSDGPKTDANQYYFALNYDITNTHKFKMNGFLTEGDFSGGFKSYYQKFYGGYIGLLGSFSKLEHSEILTYRDGDYNSDYGLNLNISLSYNLTNNLNIYFKGINLLNKALKTDYYKVNFLGNLDPIEDVNVLDRRYTVGLEWQF